MSTVTDQESGFASFYLVDAFADKAFAGNAAAVIILPTAVWPADNILQSVAAEMRQAETAFVCRHVSGVNFGLRWFTPAAEVRKTKSFSFHEIIIKSRISVTLRFNYVVTPLSLPQRR